MDFQISGLSKTAVISLHLIIKEVIVLVKMVWIIPFIKSMNGREIEKYFFPVKL